MWLGNKQEVKTDKYGREAGFLGAVLNFGPVSLSNGTRDAWGPVGPAAYSCCDRPVAVRSPTCPCCPVSVDWGKEQVGTVGARTRAAGTLSWGRLVADFQSLSSRIRVQRGNRMEMPSAV